MKLRIIDYFWSIGNETKEVKTIYADLIPGKIEGVDQVTIWQIDEVKEKTVKLSIIRHDGVRIESITLSSGRKKVWRPRSFDAGHEYHMKLIEE